MSDAFRMPIEAQQAKLDRLLDDRINIYALSAKKGHLSAADALNKTRECEAIRATFAMMVANKDAVRRVFVDAQHRARNARDLAEIEAEESAAADLIRQAREMGAAVAVQSGSGQQVAGNGGDA